MGSTKVWSFQKECLLLLRPPTSQKIYIVWAFRNRRVLAGCHVLLDPCPILVERVSICLPCCSSSSTSQIYKVTRCLARYSPRTTTTSRPTNRRLGTKMYNFDPKIWIFGAQSQFFVLESWFLSTGHITSIPRATTFPFGPSQTNSVSELWVIFQGHFGPVPNR